MSRWGSIDGPKIRFPHERLWPPVEYRAPVPKWNKAQRRKKRLQQKASRKRNR